MADQAGSGTVAGLPRDHGTVSPAGLPGSHAGESFHGRAVSWVAVAIIMAGFLAGGLALVFGPVWWLFWTAAGVVVAGGLIALATGITNDWY